MSKSKLLLSELVDETHDSNINSERLLKNYKIYVKTDEENLRAKEFLFELGYGNYDSIRQNNNHRFIFASSFGNVLTSLKCSDFTYDCNECIEITLTELEHIVTFHTKQKEIDYLKSLLSKYENKDFVVVAKEIPEKFVEVIATNLIDEPVFENDKILFNLQIGKYKSELEQKKIELRSNYKAMINIQTRD